MLLDTSDGLVDSVSLGTQITDMGYTRISNGYGNFIIHIQAPTFSANNNNTSVQEFSDEVILMTVFSNPANTEINITVDKSSEQSLQIING